MIENEKDSVYLITHSYGEVIDGITYDETSAKFLVDKLNEKYEKIIKNSNCKNCKLNNYTWGVKNCNKNKIHTSNFYTYCENDINEYGVIPYKYHYQKIDVLDINKMLGEENL
nr:hypothetical protein [uncultured Lachnoclostridium sp.]